MRTDDSITVTTVVAVDPATAFRVFTVEVDAWWRRGPRYRLAGERGALRFDPGAGGRLVETLADGSELEVGRVLVWEPGARLVFEWRGRGFRPGEKTEVDVRFDAAARGTRVTLEHRGWSRLPADHPFRQGRTGPAFTDSVGLLWADQAVAFAAATRASGRSARDGA